MPICPKGHNSTATDYCDECGAPMSASPAAPAAGAAGAPEVAPSAASPAAASPAATSSAATSSAATSSAATSSAATSSTAASSAAGETCPECGTARDGRFCEVCGHDFLATASPSPNGAVAAPASPAGSTPDPAAAGAPAAPTAAEQASPTPAGARASAGMPEWRIVATADKAYYDRIRATADADAEPVAFPAFCPQRRFVLAGPQVLIGRHSRSRGIEPGIDLTGPPEDAGVSHSHALLVAGADGMWCVVDLDSANGTYLNDATDPLPPNQPTMLAAGDQIHLGAWTTLTITTA